MLFKRLIRPGGKRKMRRRRTRVGGGGRRENKRKKRSLYPLPGSRYRPNDAKKIPMRSLASTKKPDETSSVLGSPSKAQEGPEPPGSPGLMNPLSGVINPLFW